MFGNFRIVKITFKREEKKLCRVFNKIILCVYFSHYKHEMGLWNGFEYLQSCGGTLFFKQLCLFILIVENICKKMATFGLHRIYKIVNYRLGFFGGGWGMR